MLRSVLPPLASALSIAGWIPPSEEPVISTDLYTWSLMPGGDTRARRSMRSRGVPCPRRDRVPRRAAGPSARRLVRRLLEHAEQLADAADEQPLLVDRDPRAGARGEHDVVAALDRHPDARALPPVEAGADGEDDPVLRRRLVRTRRDEQARLTDPVGLELLDDD